MLTRVLIAINVIVYAWESFTGNPNDSDSLLAHGALLGAPVVAGEWWRIVTSEFLHAGLLHIGSNMVALYQVGTFVEALYGRTRMGAIYAISILGSGLAVLWFNFDVVTVGASGAIFGLFGALLAAGLRLGKPGRSLVQQSAGIIVLNLILGFTVFHFVSNAAHIGGAIVGFLAGFGLFLGPKYRAAAAEEAATGTVAIESGTYEPPSVVHESPPA